MGSLWSSQALVCCSSALQLLLMDVLQAGEGLFPCHQLQTAADTASVLASSRSAVESSATATAVVMRAGMASLRLRKSLVIPCRRLKGGQLAEGGPVAVGANHPQQQQHVCCADSYAHAIGNSSTSLC